MQVRNDFYLSSFSYDGSVFHNQADSKTPHRLTTLAKIDEAPLAVGGNGPTINKAEILDISSNVWTEVAEYPYHESLVFRITRIELSFRTFKTYFSIYYYATVTTSQGALFIGGEAAGSEVATVACYKSSGWSRLDDLQSPRRYQRAIINGEKVYVIGGGGKK